MHGIIMYDLVTLEIADRNQRAARYRLARAAVRAGRERRASARTRGHRVGGWLGRWPAGRAAAPSAQPQAGGLAIPDYPHEMFGPAVRDTVPAPRPEAVPGQNAGR